MPLWEASRSARAPRLATKPIDTGLVTLARQILAREVASIGAPEIGAPSEPQALDRIVAGSPDVAAIAPSTDIDRLRRQAHELIETLLATVSPREASSDERVPLVRCESAVDAGADAHATLRILNEEATTSTVALYVTNFVSDTGHDIPATSVTFSPRSVDVPPGNQATLTITIRVPAQAPAGTYSALIQARGTLYVKAVVSVEVK